MSGPIHNRVSEAQKHLKPGDPVLVTRDDGTRFLTTVRAAPYQMAGLTWCVFVVGVIGSYALCRVKPAKGGDR